MMENDKLIHVDETCRVFLRKTLDGQYFAFSNDRLPDDANGEPQFSCLNYNMGGPYKTERLAARAVLLMISPVMLVLYLSGKYPGYFEEIGA